MGMSVLFEKLSKHRRALAKQLADPAIAGFWQMVVDKYSERAHFLYELIQNADDAQATYVRIVIEDRGVYFIHNGSIPFTVTDPDDEGKNQPIGHLNSLTSVGSSTKQDSDDKIGKFGIGFKSIFQYTQCPHIEDDNFSFCLHDYIVPIEDKRIENMRNAGETLFYLPFANPPIALSDIHTSLQMMDNPLIFMSNLKSITWVSTGGCVNGRFSKKICGTNTFIGRNSLDVRHEFVNLDGTVGDAKGNYHYFWSSVQHENRTLKIAVVYGADAHNHVAPLSAADNLFCYFPVNDRIEELPFLIHAPFLLTENREQIKKTEPWNLLLSEQLACLASSVLLYHSKYENCETDILSLFPLEDKSDSFLLTPVVKQLVDTLREIPVIKTMDGFRSAEQIRYCDVETLVSQLSDELMAMLECDSSPKNWGYRFLHKLSVSDRSRKVDFLKKHNLIGEYLAPESLIAKLTPTFMDNQPMQWVSGLYSILSKKKTLLSAEVIRKTPFVRCEDGLYRAAYSQNGSAQLFVRKKDDDAETTNLFYVDNSLADEQFCNLIGINEPSEETYIEKSVLAAYAERKKNRLDIGSLAKDMERLVAYFTSVLYKDEERKRFIELAKSIPFVASKRGDDCIFAKPSSLYFHSEDLVAYFSCTTDYEVIDADLLYAIEPSMRDKTYFFLQNLGVSFYPRLVDVNRPSNQEVLSSLKLEPKSLRVMDNGDQIIADKEFDGFESFLKSWNVKSAIAFYNMLSKMIGECGAYFFRMQLNGLYSYYEKAKKNRTEEPILHTTAYSQLFKMKWLPSVNGQEISLDEVADATDLDEKCYLTDANKQVLMFFGINFDSKLLNLTPEQRAAVLLVNQLKERGITENDLQALLSGKATISYK